jgi:glycosyltransferase involved in cell wall biosynthesis
MAGRTASMSSKTSVVETKTSGPITGAGANGAVSAPAEKRRETVAVVIPTLNVAPIIQRCLDRLTWADEVIIVDMFSTDDTRALCESYPNVRFFERKDYIYGNVNFGMEQARTDWVIRLDSDELINEDLKASILKVLENPEPDVNGYIFPSIQYMFGMPMHHGVGLPEMNQRKCMFRKGTARYECKAEHEDITTTGTLKILSGFYEHHTNHNTEDIVRKFNYYTEKDVERTPNSVLAPPRPRHILYRAARMFILYYFQWKGYKDGYLGFFSSLFRGPVYMFIEEAKRWEAWEKHRKGERPEPGGRPEPKPREGGE